MISMKELNPRGHTCTSEVEANLQHLYEVINIIRAAYGKPMVVTSGLRSWDEHVDIYVRNGAIEFDSMGAIKVRRGRSFPTKSAHLSGLAVDIRDRDDHFWGWCMDEIDFLAALGVYLEDKRSTKGWTHCQLVPPKSGYRVFIP